ncbi:MAG: hypothetical protein GEU90_19535 [Gemmatimonas sp.]|nr:hypothetical protein [Gemmatimonas sp.]
MRIETIMHPDRFARLCTLLLGSLLPVAVVSASGCAELPTAEGLESEDSPVAGLQASGEQVTGNGAWNHGEDHGARDHGKDHGTWDHGADHDSRDHGADNGAHNYGEVQ